MTVSVVLHGTRSSARVSEATRARVLAVAARLCYRPNGVARGLNSRRMNTLGVVATIDGGELNLYFLEVLNGILEAAAQHGQNTTVLSVMDWQADESRILHSCDGRVDGIILLAPHGITHKFSESLLRHTHFVTIHSSDPHPGTTNLDIDNEGGAHAVVQYVIAQGHQRIACFPGHIELPGVQQRVAGYRRALEEAGISYSEELVVPGKFSAASGRKRMERMLADSGTTLLPTAIFCANDAIAVGSMEALALNGLRVPEDISIVGFDDTLAARTTTPPLTTVRQPLRDMGHRAVERLLEYLTEDVNNEAAAVPEHPISGQTSTACLAAPHPAPTPTTNTRAPFWPGTSGLILPYTEVFPFELVVRKSVGPPRE